MEEDNKARVYLTVKEIMNILGVSRPTVYKMIRQGKLECLNTGKKYLFHPSMLPKKGRYEK